MSVEVHIYRNVEDAEDVIRVNHIRRSVQDHTLDGVNDRELLPEYRRVSPDRAMNAKKLDNGEMGLQDIATKALYEHVQAE